MIRIIDLPVDEIGLDPEAASKTVDAAIRRHGGMKAVGLGLVAERVLIFLEPADADAAPVYRFAPLEDGPSAAAAIAEIKARYYAGFRTVGLFECRARIWGLFEQVKDLN